MRYSFLQRSAPHPALRASTLRTLRASGSSNRGERWTRPAGHSMRSCGCFRRSCGSISRSCRSPSSEPSKYGIALATHMSSMRRTACRTEATVLRGQDPGRANAVATSARQSATRTRIEKPPCRSRVNRCFTVAMYHWPLRVPLGAMSNRKSS